MTDQVKIELQYVVAHYPGKKVSHYYSHHGAAIERAVVKDSDVKKV